MELRHNMLYKFKDPTDNHYLEIVSRLKSFDKAAREKRKG